MEESGKNVAAFVMKTYQMVSDPSTDHIIGWGRAYNSFQVLEPLEFAPIVLPSYFKHNNFSSFVRQLNTYGFRKVDPDKWEFANKYFLRGQNHLLSSIVRRKHPTLCHDYYFQLDDDQRLLVEIQRLRDDQRALDKDLNRMNQRLEVAERRPQQMMAFLNQLAQNPDILPSVIMQRDLDDGEKRHRLMGWATEGEISATNATFDVDQSFPSQDKNVLGSLNIDEHYNWAETSGLNPCLTVYDETNTRCGGAYT